MPRVQVELLFIQGCPNLRKARAALAETAGCLGVAWSEVDLEANDVPFYAKGYGSPSVLSDGVDVEGRKPVGGECACRVDFREGVLRARLRSRLESMLHRRRNHPHKQGSEET